MSMDSRARKFYGCFDPPTAVFVSPPCFVTRGRQTDLHRAAGERASPVDLLLYRHAGHLADAAQRIALAAALDAEEADRVGLVQIERDVPAGRPAEQAVLGGYRSSAHASTRSACVSKRPASRTTPPGRHADTRERTTATSRLGSRTATNHRRHTATGLRPRTRLHNPWNGHAHKAPCARDVRNQHRDTSLKAPSGGTPSAARAFAGARPSTTLRPTRAPRHPAHRVDRLPDDDRRLHRLDLAEERPDVGEPVAAPVLQETRRLRRHLPGARIQLRTCRIRDFRRSAATQ